MPSASGGPTCTGAPCTCGMRAVTCTAVVTSSPGTGRIVTTSGPDSRPAGRLSGPLVVSMRPVPGALVPTAVQVTARMPQVHGAPVHVGAPEALGIADLGAPDFGDPVEPADGDIPVFWACGVTPQAALMASRPPFAITHAPGHMFVTDVPDAVYRAM